MMQGSLAERLRVLRAREGLGLSEAAERLNINRQTLSQLERGRREPYGPTLRKLANGYGVSIAELLEGEEASALSRKDKGPRGAGPTVVELEEPQAHGPADEGRAIKVEVTDRVSIEDSVLTLRVGDIRAALVCAWQHEQSVDEALEQLRHRAVA